MYSRVVVVADTETLSDAALGIGVDGVDFKDSPGYRRMSGGVVDYSGSGLRRREGEVL